MVSLVFVKKKNVTLSQVTVSATSGGEISFIRALSSPAWFERGHKPSFSLDTLLKAIRHASKVAADDVESLVKPVVSVVVAAEKQKLVSVSVGRGVVHRLSRSSEYWNLIAKAVGGGLKIKSNTELEMRSNPEDVKALFGPTWDDYVGDRSVRCMVNRVVGYGAFVTALVGESMEFIPGLSGLLHFSRAGVDGTSLSAVELTKQLKENQVVNVRLVGWSDQGPMLARVK